MKKLLNKSIKTFSIYSFLVLIASVPAYYFLVDSIWMNELDENNRLIATRTEQELNKLHLNIEELERSLFLWNKIQPHTSIQPHDSLIIETTYTLSRQNPYVKEEDINRFRGLRKGVTINGKHYILVVETIIEESDETVWAIAKLTMVFFLLLVVGFLLLNRRLSNQLWKPFRHTLAQLKSFQFNKQSTIEFEHSNTFEFEELNDSLRKLIAENISIYTTQKEFTENASHELQTPLALIKGKLDLLLQQQSMTTTQYEIVEEINLALTRVSRINKNLLLLAKIDNNQFEKLIQVDINKHINDCILFLEEHFFAKGIKVETQIEDDIQVEANTTLFDILINNLLLNALKHSPKNTTLNIVLNKKGFVISNFGEKALSQQKLFKRFSSVTDHATGTGLGLAIIKQICIVHDWNIQYDFEVNRHHFQIDF